MSDTPSTSQTIMSLDEFELPNEGVIQQRFDENIFSLSFNEDDRNENISIYQNDIFRNLGMITSTETPKIEMATAFFVECTTSYKETVNLLLVEEFMETFAMVINDNDNNDSCNRVFSILHIMQKILRNEDVRGPFINALNFPSSIEKYLIDVEHPHFIEVVINIFILIIYYEKHSPASSLTSDSGDQGDGKVFFNAPDVPSDFTSATRDLKSSHFIFSSKILAQSLVDILQRSALCSLSGSASKLLRHILQYDSREVFMTILRDNEEFNFVSYFMKCSDAWAATGGFNECLQNSKFEHQPLFFWHFGNFQLIVLKLRSPWIREYVKENFISILLWAINILPWIYREYSIISEVSCFINEFIDKFRCTKEEELKHFLTGNVNLMSNMVVYLTESIRSRDYNYISNVASIFKTLLDKIEGRELGHTATTVQSEEFSSLLRLLLDDSTHSYLTENFTLCESIKKCLRIILLLLQLSAKTSELHLTQIRNILNHYKNDDSDKA